MRRRFCAAALLLTCLGAAGPAAADPHFDVIAPLPGAGTSDALGVSGDGCRVVGHSGFEAFSWRDGVTLRLPEPTPQIAYAVTPDGRVVVGYAGHDFFRMDEAGLERIHVPGGAGNPTEARAVSADGQSIGGCTHATEVGMHCDWPFLWKSGTGSTLLPGVSGSIEVGSVEAISADGAIAAGAAGGRAVIWHPGAGTVQDLGALPGHMQGVVHDLTPDGGVAVGRSGPESHPSARAFRWTAASGMVELGPDARAAHAVSADGERIVGDGPLGAFLWDPVHGVRPLADVLRDDYGLDLGGFQLGSATAISPDGKTIVGIGGVPGSQRRGWRARLHEDRCPPPPALPVIDLVAWHSRSAPTLAGPVALGIDSRARLSVTGLSSRSVVRMGTDLASLANPQVESLVDFSADPLPTPETWDVPVVLAVGPDDSVYVGASGREQLLRVAPDGSVSVVIDGSVYPPLEYDGGPLPTAPIDAAFGPGGQLYVSARARLLRVDPDGSVHQLIDAVEAQAAVYVCSCSLQAPLFHVEVDAQNRVFLSSGQYLLVLDGELGTVLDSHPQWELPTPTIMGMKLDSEGALWLFETGIWRRDPDGAIETIFGPWDIPDGAGGRLIYPIRELAVDGAGNLYYFGENWDYQPLVIRRTPDGVLTRVLTPDTIDSSGDEIGNFYAADLLVSEGVLFVAEYGDRVFRVELPRLPTACANGLDDDGDGAADFPADAGCVSEEDEGERSLALSCDNGVDEDGDGAVDYPADPGCAASDWPREATACDDDVDNDGDGAADWDGAGIGPADPECAGDPLRVIEQPWYCGLGFEVALLLPIYTAVRRWKRGSARPESGFARLGVRAGAVAERG